MVVSASLPFTVMAKPVGSLCNVNCSYCYYLKTPRSGQTSAQPRMTDEMLERFIRQYIEASGGPVVSFVWHGGEPSLAGLTFYKRAVELQKRHLPEGWSCWNNLQTNGVLLDDEWCAFLAESGFDVGVSIDGTQQLHDRFRKDHSGSGTFQAAQAAVRRLQAYGIQPDLLCTVTSAAAKAPVDVYRGLRELNTRWVQFIPIVRRESGGVTEDSVSGKGYGKFLCDVFDEWVLRDIGRVSIQFFEETARVWAGGSAGLCWMAPVCGRALIVEQDGGVYSCDHFVYPEYRIGDISSAHLGELADSLVQLGFGESKSSALTTQCRSCEWLAVCNGGCPKDRFAISEDGEPGHNHLCSGLMRFFSYVRPAVNLVTALSKQGHSPDVIMSHLREQLSTIWKGVGRNDPCPCGSGKKAKSCCWEKRP